jgi:hypothetical protein
MRRRRAFGAMVGQISPSNDSVWSKLALAAFRKTAIAAGVAAFLKDEGSL